MAKPETYWIIRCPDGDFWTQSFRAFSRNARPYAVNSLGLSWKQLYRRGYRWVKVNLVEVRRG